MQHRSKHTSGKVFRASYMYKIADAAMTLFAAGHGHGGNAQNFYWQQHYTQGRQLMTTDKIKEICPPPIWQFINDTLYPGLDEMMAELIARGTNNLTDQEDDFRAQIRLTWYFRETILQDAVFLYPLYHNSNLFRDSRLFQDVNSPFMIWILGDFSKAVREWHDMGLRAHDAIIRQRAGATVLDEARERLSIFQATMTEHSRLLLIEINRLLDARRQDKQLPAPQPQPAFPPAPATIKGPTMPTFPTHVTKAPGLAPLWEYWGTCANITCPAMPTPPCPLCSSFLFCMTKLTGPISRPAWTC